MSNYLNINHFFVGHSIDPCRAIAYTSAEANAKDERFAKPETTLSEHIQHVLEAYSHYFQLRCATFYLEMRSLFSRYYSEQPDSRYAESLSILERHIQTLFENAVKEYKNTFHALTSIWPPCFDTDSPPPIGKSPLLD
jgi:hypothetical protein